MSKTSHNKLQICAITQELLPEYWHPPMNNVPTGITPEQFRKNFDNAIKFAAETGNAEALGNCILTYLLAAGLIVDVLYIIVHDKDEQIGWDEAKQEETIIKKATHAHLAIQFKKGGGGTLEQIAEAVGIEPQYVEKPKKGRYAWDNMLAYLTHIKYPDKYQYDPANVVTICRPEERNILSYKKIYNDRREEWIKGRAAVTKQYAEKNVDWLEEQILTGQITKSQVYLTDNLFSVYSRNMIRLDNAFTAYGERKVYKALQAIQRGDFKLSVFYITGKSGTGKTRFAKAFIDALQAQNDGWTVCATAASNPVDDYHGEEILFMDDLRGSSMSATDWLKLLDPYNITPASARYRNKIVTSRVIIITSEKNPLEFFYFTKMGGGNRSEALDQFIRRIEALVSVIDYTGTGDFEKVLINIAPSTKIAPREFEIPNSNNGYGNAKVTMNYSFDKPIKGNIETSIKTLIDIVDSNDHTKQNISISDNNGDELIMAGDVMLYEKGNNMASPYYSKIDDGDDYGG